jgi:hypothetical protein
MDKEFAMYELNASNHLIGKHKDGFQGEPTITKGEQIFKRRSEQFENENIVAMFLSTPDQRNDNQVTN